MIDLKREQLLTFNEAAKLLPCRRLGQTVSRGTLGRWHRIGKAGVRLEAVRLPSGYATSTEAIQRFISQLTERLDVHSRPNDPAPLCHSATPLVEAELDPAGI